MIPLMEIILSIVAYNLHLSNKRGEEKTTEINNMFIDRHVSLFINFNIQIDPCMVYRVWATIFWIITMDFIEDGA